MDLPKNSDTDPQTYNRRRADLYAAGFPDAHTMGPGEVDEVWERLIGTEDEPNWKSRAIYAEHCAEGLRAKVVELEAALAPEPPKNVPPLDWWESMQRATVRQLARLRAEGRV